MKKHRRTARSAKHARKRERLQPLAPVELTRRWEIARGMAETLSFESASQELTALVARVGDANLRAQVLNDLGVVEAAAGNTSDAIEHLRLAVQLTPTHLRASENLRVVERQEFDRRQTYQLSSDQYDDQHTRASAHTPRDEPTRVAIVSFLFNWPSTGGGIVHTLELAKFLRAAGYEVLHIYARQSAWGVGRVEGALPYPSRCLDFSESDWNLPTIQSHFRQAVAEFDPDHAIITDSWNMKPRLAEALREFSVILRLQALECLCPLNNLRLLPGPTQCPRHQLATPDACQQCLSQHRQLSGSLHQAERALAEVESADYPRVLRQAFAEATAVLVVNSMTEAMIAPFCRHVRVCPSGFDPDRFPWPWPDRESTSSSRPTRILFAGLVDEGIKGFHVLQEACAQLWRKRRDFELLATADPPGQVNEFTRYLGWTSQEALPGLLRSCDILAFPTIAQEALGRTAVEAMAVGRPVVASRIGGLPQTVGEGAGLLFEPGNAVDLAQKLEILLDDPELRERMGAIGRRRFEAEFTWPTIIDQHYQPLLTKSTQRSNR